LFELNLSALFPWEVGNHFATQILNLELSHQELRIQNSFTLILKLPTMSSTITTSITNTSTRIPLPLKQLVDQAAEEARKRVQLRRNISHNGTPMPIVSTSTLLSSGASKPSTSSTTINNNPSAPSTVPIHQTQQTIRTEPMWKDRITVYFMTVSNQCKMVLDHILDAATKGKYSITLPPMQNQKMIMDHFERLDYDVWETPDGKLHIAWNESMDDL
jgi:hypothetical protein